MPKEAWFDLERNEAIIPWPKLIRSVRQIVGFTAAMVSLILITAVIDQRDFTPYIKAASWVAVLVPLGMMLVYTLERHTIFNRPIGISPTAMVAPGGRSGTYIEWSKVRVLVYCPPMFTARYEPPTDDLVAIMRDNRRERVALPRMRNGDFDRLVTLLETIADIHGFEFVRGSQDDGE